MSKKKKKPSRNPAKPVAKRKPIRPPAPKPSNVSQKTTPVAPVRKPLPFWLVLSFLAAFLAGGASTVYLTGGFSNDVTPAVFLMAMAGGFLFTAILSALVNYMAGSRPSKKGVQKAIIILMAFGLIGSLALTAIGSFDEPSSNRFSGETPAP